MNLKIVLIFTLFINAGSVLAVDSPTPTNTFTPTITYTPQATNTPILAPTWAPESAGPVPPQMMKNKPAEFTE